MTPAKMTGQRPSFAPGGPTPMRKSVPGTKDEEVDAGEVLPGYGFQGLKVTEVRRTSALSANPTLKTLFLFVCFYFYFLGLQE